MPRGGARPNSGKRKGSHELAKSPLVKRIQGGLKNRKCGRVFATALEYAMSVINDPDASEECKTRLAIALLPFQHPRITEDDKPKKKELKAKEAEKAATGKFGPPPPPRLVASNG